MRCIRPRPTGRIPTRWPNCNEPKQFRPPPSRQIKNRPQGAVLYLAERGGLLGFRVASAKASSLISFGTACGILRKRCLLVEPKGVSSTPPLNQIKNHPQGAVLYLAERGGFEPPLGYKPKHAFQACDLNRSSTSPDGLAATFRNTLWLRPPLRGLTWHSQVSLRRNKLLRSVLSPSRATIKLALTGHTKRGLLRNSNR